MNKREIKFRAWMKDEKRMITHEQGFIPLKVSSMGILRLDPTREDDFYNIINTHKYDLMQFTGKKDLNGTDIYEGDVVSIQNYELISYDSETETERYGDCDCEVKWSGAGFCVDGDNDMGEIPLDAFDPENMTVVGNVYANPELLKL